MDEEKGNPLQSFMKEAGKSHELCFEFTMSYQPSAMSFWFCHQL